MYYLDELTSLFLGQPGENLHSEIRIDMSSWLNDYPTLKCYILALRHGEEKPYLAATGMEDNVLRWTLTSSDTQYAGRGLCMIVGSDGTKILKSKRVKTTVGDNLPGLDEDEPTIYQGAAEQLIAEIASYKTNVEKALSDLVELKVRVQSMEDGASSLAKLAILNCFRHVAWIDDQGPIWFAALEAAFNAADTTQLVAIQAVYVPSKVVHDTDTLDSLRTDLTVTAVYANGVTEVITDYELEGTLAVGTSIIRVNHDGKTAVINVVVAQDSTDPGTDPDDDNTVEVTYDAETGLLSLTPHGNAHVVVDDSLLNISDADNNPKYNSDTTMIEM